MRLCTALAACLLAATALGGGAVGADAQTRMMRLGLVTPPPHVWTKVAKRFAETLGEDERVDLEIMVFPASQLGSEPEMFQQMDTGVLDMMIATLSSASLRAPDMVAWFTPFLFEDVAHAGRAADTEAARAMLDELEPAGLKGLGYTFAGMRHLLTTDEAVTGIADLAGMKVRIVPFPAMASWWRAAGAAPTAIELANVYQSLQTGVLDGTDIDLDALLGLKFQEAGRNLTLTGHMAWPAVFLMSGATWQGFSELERTAVSEAAREALAWGLEAQIEAENVNLKALESEIAVHAMADAEARFADANAAFTALYGDLAGVRHFQAEAAALR